MEAELTALAEAGAVALVTAMGTELWPQVRPSVAELFRHGNRDRATAIEAHLDDTAARVRGAADPDDARRELVGFWILELAERLRRDPAAPDVLVHLVRCVGSALPDEPGGDPRRPARQRNETTA
ncbi:hypothetical protein [Nocardia sp. alder85J]|uniref:hypothetical protein n=1 Tax=Nocardia sp. alder85J TaxID=2862949 RepID=UPI001CD5E77B|nr:hypothetical protein [Nocardia sp. alder85J]MCX4095522.1 hypothetical protein [Nocardia sp. alder85J]